MSECCTTATSHSLLGVVPLLAGNLCRKLHKYLAQSLGVSLRQAQIMISYSNAKDKLCNTERNRMHPTVEIAK